MTTTTIDKKPFFINATVLAGIIVSTITFSMWAMKWKYDHESRIIYLEEKAYEQQIINKETQMKSSEIQVQLAEMRGDIKLIKQLLMQWAKQNESIK
jgi:hypothetical protein